jgi:hypothetical protein
VGKEIRRVGKAKRAHHRPAQKKWWARRKSAFAHPAIAFQQRKKIRHGRASSRPSTSFLPDAAKDVDARHKAGHDDFRCTIWV